MPFKSEAQRKYLWANEPEIARDWTDTYGSRIQKAGGGIGQLVQPGIGRPGYNGALSGDYTPDRSGRSDVASRDVLTGQRDLGQTVAKRPTPTITPKDEGSWFEKNIYDRRPHDYTARSKHIQNLSKVDMNKLIAAGLWQPGEEEDYFEGSWMGDSPLTSAESLRQLQDLTGYTGGFGNANDPRSPNYDPRSGEQPYLPPTGSAGIDDTTSTASTLGGLDFLVPLEYVVGGVRAAEGGRIGYQEGNMVGGEMGGMNPEMQSAMMESKEVIKELYDALIAQGLSPQEAMEKIKEMIAASQAQESESPMMGEEFPGQEFRGGPRAPAAFGGIMDTYTGRRKYGLGSFFKSAKKKLKKLASSKLGKIALMYAAGTYLGGMEAFGGEGVGWQKFGARLLDPMGPEGIANVGRTAAGWFSPSTTTTAPQLAGTGAYGGIERGAPLLKGATKQLTKAAVPWYKNPWITIPGAAIGAGLYTAEEDEQEDISGEWKRQKADMDRYLANLGSLEGGDYRVPKEYRVAQGGRIGRQEGGLMDLGGMEKDYRDDGGFVPLGGEEKADDVPARLSKNEFVFTADAVRNAGGGDIDRGAEVMENVMKNLEAGGQVSEESQGQGAQDMFEVSERLSEVV